MVIPKIMQKQILDKIHCGHQGIQKCRLRVNSSVWWPGVSRQVEDYIKACPTCIAAATPHREPMILSPLPKFPWEKIGTDLFELHGKVYPLVVDYFSRYIEVQKMNETTSKEVIASLKALFSRHGIPAVLVSDNGPQYSSKEMQEFADQYGFQHITSSPHYPQSNGLAERSVKTVKSLLDKSADPYIALLSYRTTPFPWCGLSPAELYIHGKEVVH